MKAPDLISGLKMYLDKRLLIAMILLKDSLITTGEPYSPTLLAKERSRLRRIYGDRGYLDTKSGYKENQTS